MNKRFILTTLAFVPLLSFAQPGQYPAQGRGGYNAGGYRYNDMQYDNSVLSIFSENGEPFFLVLNGVKQNISPVTKIRVESLPKYQNDVQIYFTDNTPAIRRTVNIADPIDAKAVNLTLRISRGRGGMAKLKFHRMSECDRNYHGPRDEYVMYYGKPQQINTVTETNYMDPVTGQWITETTTTTTENYNTPDYSNPRGSHTSYNTTPPPPRGPMAMDARSFNDAKQSISGASFDNTKLSTAKTILNSNYVTTDQVMEMCKLFSFENSKISFAQFAYSRVVDPQNYFKVGSVFDFDANKQALNDYISRNPR